MLLQRQVSTKWEKIRAFFADQAERSAAEGGFMAIVEVCGMNPWLIDMLQEHGCREIVVTQPEQRSKKKTDRRDAAFLSNLLWLNRQRLAGGQEEPKIRVREPHQEAPGVRTVQRRGPRDNASHTLTRTA